MASSIRILDRYSVEDQASGVCYTPVVSVDGRVGYRVDHLDSEDFEFIYFNPSQSEGPGDANVFVYHGIAFDPAEDMPLGFYSLPGQEKGPTWTQK